MRRFRAAFLLLLTACVSAPPAREGEHRPGPASPQGVRVDPDLLREIDAVLQERFANVTAEDIKLSRFGFSRISPKEAHRKTFVPESEREREMLRRVSASGMRAAVYTVGNWHGPPPVAQGPLALGG